MKISNKCQTKENNKNRSLIEELANLDLWKQFNFWTDLIDVFSIKIDNRVAIYRKVQKNLFGRVLSSLGTKKMQPDLEVI